MKQYARFISGKRIGPVLRAFALGVLIMLACPPVRAQDDAPVYSYTETEKIGFAFHKLSGIEPDFRRWVSVREEYIHSMTAERLKMMRAELDRLWHGYGNYTPGADLIDLTLPATIVKSPVAGEDGTRMVPLIFEPSLQHYFPVRVEPLWVALIPENQDLYRVLEFSDSEYKKLQNRVNFGEDGKADVMVEFRLRALEADSSAPVLVDDFELWPMLVEIASINIWTPQRTSNLWSYNAPSYNPAGFRREQYRPRE